MPYNAQDHHRFENLLFSLSTGDSLDSGDLETASKEILQTAVDGLNVQRASIWFLNRNNKRLYCDLLLDTVQGWSIDHLEISEEDFPNYFSCLYKERTIVAHDAISDPQTSELAKPYLNSLKITSMLDCPVRNRGEMVGIICCEHIGRKRYWTAEEQNFASTLSDFLGRSIAANERRQAEIALIQSEEMFRCAFDHNIIPMALYTMKGKTLKVNSALIDMLGYSEIKLLTTPMSDYFHPDDKALARKYYKKWQHDDKEHHSLDLRFVTSQDKVLWISMHTSIIFNDLGKPTHMVGVYQNMTANRLLSTQLSYQATHDALTGLLNRAEFERQINELLRNTLYTHSEHALCYLDLDQFKVVNDTCGHAAGDELLRQLGHLLQKCVRGSDTLARLGGDEFGLLIENCSLSQARRVASFVMETIKDFQFVWGSHRFQIGVSMGVAPLHAETASVSEILQQADIACFAAKDSGRNRINIYQEDDMMLMQRRGEMNWVSRIHRAIDESRLTLYAQPIIPLKNKHPTRHHFEILLRMLNEDGGVILPGVFMAAAERYNLMSKIDRWVIKNTFAQVSSNSQFLESVDFLSINLSGQSLTDEGLQQYILEALDSNGIDHKKICFEITETAAIANLSHAIEFIDGLHQLGCRFALDDFGSGLSSFAYLRDMKVDYLKIDGLFVKDIADDPIDRGFVKTINELAQLMNLKTIAEFVETEEILSITKEIGIDYAQGHLIGRPLPLKELIL